MSEVKGLMVQTHTLMINRYFSISSNDYAAELNATNTKFNSRLREYYSLFTRMIPQFPKHIRRCETSSPARGVNFIELQRFSRITLLNEDFVRYNGCTKCPKESKLSDVSRRTNTTITDCKQIGNILTVCPAKPDSPHEYLWWRDDDGNQYAPTTPCDNEKKIRAHSFPTNGSMATFYYFPSCKVCACSTEINDFQNDASAIWRVSVTDQYSDFYNNKVVTGVRFVIMDQVLHIQIQQAAVSQSGMIHGDNQWKDLDLGFHDAGIEQTKAPMSVEALRPNRKTFYLDDIKAPIDHVVTGVRLKLVDDFAFMLQIYVCQFQFDIGEVFPFGCSWIDASGHPMNPDDYKARRFEIDMGKSDDPTRASQFQYEFQSNKQIKFTHTDIYKDAGQTTIPLIDSQCVEAHPPFPLGGIGLSFRGRKGFGGYIAPRIFTFEYAQSMKFPEAN